jgi:hypothetical protein
MAVERTRVVAADAEAAWAVVSDMGGYANHVNGLAETSMVEGAELGSVRRCVDTSGADWQETCVAWLPGSRFTVEVDVASYPLKFRTLFSAFRGTWWLDELEGETVVGIRFEAELRRVATTMRRQIEQRIEHDLDDILSSYDTAITGRVGGTLDACPDTPSEP